MGWFNVISNSQTCRQFILFYYSFGAKILLTQRHCTRGKVGDSHSIYYMYIIYHVLYHIIVIILI